jgi:AcrR family transcriptional regulator
MASVKRLRKAAPAHGVRRRRAEATRRRIVEATVRLFAERGYAGTTMTAIAQQAKVAVQTVYFTFHTKTELLVAVADLAITGGAAGGPEGLAWTQAALSEPDARRRIAIVVDATADIAPRMLPIIDAWRAAIAVDPSAAAMYRERLRSRRAFLRRVVDVTAGRGELRSGLDPERATDIFFALTTPETYGTFTDVLGWRVADWRAWADRTLEHELLGDRARMTRPRAARTAR